MAGTGDDLAKELMAVFTLEAGERVQTINEHLLALEKALSVTEIDRLLAEIFREAHSLKGAARAVNLTSAEAVAHRLESLLLEMQGGSVARDRAVFDLIYETVDVIASLAAGGPEEAGPDVDGLCARLQAVTGPAVPAETAGDLPLDGSARGRAVEEPARAAAELAVDLAVSQPAGSVRVTTEKLDALSASAGELLAARTLATRRRSELQELVEDLRDWRRGWAAVRPLYRRLQLTGSSTDRGRGTTSQPRWDPLLAFFEDNERRLRALLLRTEELARVVEHDGRHQDRLTRDIHDEVRRTRMMPVRAVLQGVPRMVRDLSGALNKDVVVRIEGEDAEVDRAVLERLGDPLTHLLRNCIDHGIEDPAERRLAGKPPEATIVVRVAQRGEAVRIEVEDDGAGIDVDGVVETAVARGVVTREEARALSASEALWLVFRPGFSTSPMITDLSGRGVGLDVVRKTVERLHGTVDVVNRPGEGATFALVLPLTLATTFSLLVEAAGEAFGLPITNVVSTVRLRAGELSVAQGGEVARIGGEPVPVAHLADLLGLPKESQDAGDADGARVAALVASGEKRMALIVDRLLGTQEVVLKNLPRPLGGGGPVAAASILGSGDLVMVLNVSEVIRSTPAQDGAERAVEPAPGRGSAVSILVADDSITTRTLERNILQSAGYEVKVAADGVEAWMMLRQAGCDLLVSDVNMPRLDGFQLTERIRSDPRLKDLPVVLVTSLDDPSDRERGVAVGADAYIVKGSFDQDRLLETIRRLV